MTSKEQTRRNFLKINPWCHYCGLPSESVDHILPVGLGGCSARWNYAPSCVKCNHDRDNRFPRCTCWRCSNALACAVVAPLVGRNYLRELSEGL